ncbi:uncharacterized protein F4822DRAFT_440788 [Hypoxylon trugodes]|uniref:uncharacterized protein n=1 Tax=Hypoxylon trugodes TaxID=326681 RepID=UPI00219A6348|nr:uncharacterized protein F4822DRAFT_440788 [Hypoxylon trugodes]KAI1383104.1 hypothetical protein F4822DRAFT_440788 [Hypoxylon trugodes]
MGASSSIPTDPNQRVQVIAAGYGRTGTVSTALALERLLKGPVLHGGSQLLVRDDKYCKLWLDAYKAKDAGDKKKTLKLVKEATAGFVATADVPPVDFIPELMELYPEAKVVLVRRDPEKWWKSVVALTSKATPWWLDVAMAPIPGWRYIPAFMRRFSKSFLGLAGVSDDKASPAELIERGGPFLLVAHNRRVRSVVPKRQLLEMELREGWKPLCQFLGVRVPKDPFPRANDAKAVDEHAARIFTRVLQVWVGIFSTTAVVVYTGWWLWRNKQQSLIRAWKSLKTMDVRKAFGNVWKSIRLIDLRKSFGRVWNFFKPANIKKSLGAVPKAVWPESKKPVVEHSTGYSSIWLE